MSFDHTRAAWQFAEANPSLSEYAVLILLALANRENPKTGQLNPSIARIARDAHVSERTVKRAIAELEQAGALAVVRTTGGSYRSTNSYTLFIPNGVPTGRGPHSTPSCQTGEGAPTVLGGGSVWPPKQYEPVSETAPSGVVDISSRRGRKIVPELNDADRAAAQQFFDALKEKKA